MKRNTAKRNKSQLAMLAALFLSIFIYSYLLTNDYNQLQSSFQELAQANQTLSSEYEELSHENRALRGTLEESEMNLLDTRKQLKLTQEQVEALRQEVQQMQQEEERRKAKAKEASSLPSRGEQAEPWINFKATYYDANFQSTGKNPGDAGYGITASGRQVTEGITIAVDPKVIPLGTWVLIKYPDGKMEKRRADDTGSAVKGHHIDIYIPKASLTSGNHIVQVRVLK